MARSHAKLLTSIWLDDDFRALSPDAQWLYMALLSQSNLSYAGVAPLTKRRWAGLSARQTPHVVGEALAELEAARYVLVDDDTEEVLIRSFIRHDGGLKIPNVAKATVTAVACIASPRLRAEALAGVPDEYLDLFEQLLVEPLPEGLAEPSAEPIPEPSLACVPNPCPSPSPSSSPPLALVDDTPPRAATKAKARTSEPADGTLTERRWGYASTRGMTRSTAEHQWTEFLEHHRAKGNRWQDWDLAWQKWVRGWVGYGSQQARGGAKGPRILNGAVMADTAWL